MPEINFHNIRSHNDSKNMGFEELCCQLAHLDKPDHAVEFVRNGPGADGGVECYWKIDSGDEFGWQAKYFPTGMGSSEWGQITKSVKSAIKGYKNLTKYYVCIPVNLSDNRNPNQTTARNEWDTQVKKWQKLASNEGREIKFILWDCSTLVEFLSRPEPEYCGRRLYWFSEKYFSQRWFEDRRNETLAALGGRYTPDDDITLSVHHVLTAFLRHEDYVAKLRGLGKSLVDEIEKIVKDFKHHRCRTGGTLDKLRTAGDSLANDEGLVTDEHYFESYLKEYQRLDTHWRALSSKARRMIYSLFSDYKQHKLLSKLSGINEKIQNLSFELRNATCMAYKSSTFLVSGEGGIGKSHALAAGLEKALDKGQPSIMVLGQDIGRGIPWPTILQAVHLANIEPETFLAALDARAEAQKSPCVIFIDAINESEHPSDWQRHLPSLITTISRYKNIRLCISCRDDYRSISLPGKWDHSEFKHHGYAGREQEAIQKIAQLRGIALLSVPYWTPEFSNPLFIKTVFDALKASGETSFPKGLAGTSNIFKFYCDAVQKSLIAKGYSHIDPAVPIIEKALIGFSKETFKQKKPYIPYADAKEFLLKYVPEKNWKDSLLKHLLSEGILQRTKLYGRTGEFVRFSFERFSDHFIAEFITQETNFNKKWPEMTPLSDFIAAEWADHFPGVYEALSAQIPEKIKRELIDIVPSKFRKNSILCDAFFESIVTRSPSAVQRQLTRKFDDIAPHCSNESVIFDTLFKVSTEPKNALNAEAFSEHLMNIKMPERDSYWSIFLAVQYQYWEETDAFYSPLIKWSLGINSKQSSEDRAWLCAIMLTWMFTTSCRAIRDKATKALAALLFQYPQLWIGLIEHFKDVDDPYVTERLYAAIYGAACNSRDPKYIYDLSHHVYNVQFINNKPTANIMIRDYARGIMELAKHLNCLPSGIDFTKSEPPFDITWTMPSLADLDISIYKKWQEWGGIYGSLKGMPGDFGNYGMTYVDNFTHSPIISGKSMTDKEVSEVFRKELMPQLSNSQRELLSHYDELFEQFNSVQNLYNSLMWKKFTAENTDVDEGAAPLPDVSREDLDKARAAFLKTLPKELQIEFDAVYDLWTNVDGLKKMSKDLAQRWVCKKAYDLGWKKELHFEFDSSTPHGRGGSTAIERIGKKYQWIAYYELFAKFQDNYFYIDSYNDDPCIFNGPYQIYDRDIDPTCWHQNDISFQVEEWWKNADLNQPAYSKAKMRKWCQSTSDLPDIKDIVLKKCPEGNVYYNLHDNLNVPDRMGKNQPNKIFGTAWLRLVCVFVDSQNKSKLLAGWDGEYLHDPDEFELMNDGIAAFLGEWPWHSSTGESADGELEPDSRHARTCLIKQPFNSANTKKGEYDCSGERKNFYIPSKWLINMLSLMPSDESFADYKGVTSDIRFLSKSSSDDYGVALLSEGGMNQLIKNGLEPVWVMTGEKDMVSGSYDNSSGPFIRSVFTGIYALDKGSFVGALRIKIDHER